MIDALCLLLGMLFGYYAGLGLWMMIRGLWR
jgi:hypothetical protein